MGRWAQRRRRGAGGAGELPSSCNAITSAHIFDVTIAVFTFQTDVTAGDFSPGDITSSPTGNLATSFDQDGPNAIDVTFDGDITGDTDWSYTGAVPGVCTPQSGSYA